MQLSFPVRYNFDRVGRLHFAFHAINRSLSTNGKSTAVNCWQRNLLPDLCNF
jgi:hypothetical protein